MKPCWLAVLALLLVVPLRGEVKHVVIVSVDGLRPAAYLEPDRLGLKVPTLRRLVAEGASAEGMRSVLPTLTYPAHTSMVTGVTPARHGIFLNAAPDPEMRFGLRWYAEDVRARTLYQAAEEKGLRTAMVFWPVTLGAQVDALLPEFWRGDRDDLKLLRAISTPGLLQGVQERFPAFRFVTPPETRDEDLADVAVHLILTLRPHLLLLHMIGVDRAQHEFGLASPETRAAIENADAQLGRLVRALEQAGLWESTVLFVVSDHGFSPVKKVARPGVHLRQAGLLRLDERERMAAWEAAPICGGGLCEILLKHPEDAATRKKVLELFTRLARIPESGIGRLYSPEETARLSPDAGAFVLLEAAPGFAFSGSPRGEPVEPAGRPAGHGYSPEKPGQRASFVVAGAGIRQQRMTEVSILDLAPTVAFLLGLELPATEGRALRELFEMGE